MTPSRCTLTDLGEALRGPRLSLLTARCEGERRYLVALLVDRSSGEERVVEARLENPLSYPSFTPSVPNAHWHERAIADMFGIVPVGHPRFKPLRLHEAWDPHLHPLLPEGAAAAAARTEGYPFMEVQGEGVYEIPVGPIHAGIIEPGHFRFSCLGEIIQNVEIRLGYQHRGIEAELEKTPWRRGRFLAEAASSDTTVGNALAHALALEALLDVEPPPGARRLRSVALEIERLASHLGDLGGICSDIGFLGCAAVYAILRGKALGLAETLSGSRFMTGYVRPGGVARCPNRQDATRMRDEAADLARQARDARRLLLDNPAALDRMDGVGRVSPSLARDFGLVGPAARACGLPYDARRGLRVHTRSSGDVLARVEVRADELETSLELIGELLADGENGDIAAALPDSLRPSAVGVGRVEAWRGELVHLVLTDSQGAITRYAIKDPSFDNWTGLAIAVRGELVSDFPLCNKSFGLSYSGNDL